MGTILTRRRKHGGMAYMAKIILKRDKKVIHRESRTFESHKRAKDWIRDREAELSKPHTAHQTERPSVTLSDAIDRYTDESRKQIGKTKQQVLNTIQTFPIAKQQCHEITADDLTSFARQLSKGRAPSTVENYLSHLSAIFAIAKPAWNYELNRQAIEDARIVCRRLGITGKSNERTRRPTLDELDRIMNHFVRIWNYRPESTPMLKLVPFAIFSTRRLEEVSRILWADYEPQHQRIMVRDMKNPGEKIGNDIWCDLTPEAMKIIDSMPNVDGRIFPYGTDAIGMAFTRACQFLEIEDLHLHDLRHDGISRLFEINWKGGTIPHIAAVSGHRSWKSLQRYTHVRQTGDKYENWKWLTNENPAFRQGPIERVHRTYKKRYQSATATD